MCLGECSEGMLLWVLEPDPCHMSDTPLYSGAGTTLSKRMRKEVVLHPYSNSIVCYADTDWNDGKYATLGHANS